MCRGFQQSESERFLKMKAFNLRFFLASKSGAATFPDSLTLHYLPRINGTSLEVNYSKIKPDSPAFLTLHRVMATPTNGSVCFASRERVKASQGARFEVFFGDIRVLKGFFTKDDTWKMECSCGVDATSAGRILQEIVKIVEVSVVAEGDVVMNQTVEIVVKKRRKKLLKEIRTLEEIPEETEYCFDDDDDSCCEGPGCCCCDYEEDIVESESGECCGGDDEVEEMEGEVSWAVDVGIWVMCLGVGLLVSRASSKRLLRRASTLL